MPALPLPGGERAGVKGAMYLDSPRAPHPARFARHPLPFGEREESYDASRRTAFSYWPAPMSPPAKIWWRAIHSNDSS